MTDQLTQNDQKQPSSLQEIQNALLQLVINAIAIVGLVVAVAGTIEATTDKVYWQIPVYWGSYLLVTLFAFWRNAPYNLKAASLILLLALLSITEMADEGLLSSSRIFMLMIPFSAGVFYGWIPSVLALIFNAAVFGFFGWAYISHNIVNASSELYSTTTQWVTSGLTTTLGGIFIAVGINYILPRLSSLLYEAQQLTSELQQYRDHLEDEVEQRTIELERKTTQITTAAQVARDAAQSANLDELLNTTVKLISEKFGFYHTGIFLLDDKKEFAVLRAASSEGGQRMLNRGHRLRVGETGIVGYVTSARRPRIALDVGVDAVYFDNPDLPETRSEMALPLIARNEVIGALDVQSKQPMAFTEDDIEILQVLADQIALAISNTRLLDQIRQTLEAERATMGVMTREAWQRLLRLRRGLREIVDPAGLLKSNEDVDAISIPLVVRGQRIGHLNLYRKQGTGWSNEEKELIYAIAEQLSLALDSARLYEETQQTAENERILSEITTRIRETLDIETILRTIVAEVQNTFELEEVEVRMGLPEKSGLKLEQ